MKTICLNMIVKDESAVILRCLKSIKNLIDYWVIVDTGSTDGTQAIIQDFLREIPGELYERPWVNFAHNRNEALLLARNKADYLLFIDADERLVYSDGAIDKNELDQDFYAVQVRDIGSNYLRILFINQNPGWFWKGVLHEHIFHQESMIGDLLDGVVNESNFQDGSRSRDPNKYLNDAKILKKVLEDDPSDLRAIYYLGQSYGCAKEWKLALEAYEKRAALGGGLADEEYWALYMVGCIQQFLQMDPEIFIQSYCKAYLFNQSHLEPLYQISNYFFSKGEYFLGYLVASFGLTIPRTDRWLRASLHIYEYDLLFTFANCAYCLGNLTESREAYHQLLSKTELPKDKRALIEEILASIPHPNHRTL